MKPAGIAVVAIMVCTLIGCMHHVTMNSPRVPALPDIQRYPYSIGLFVPKDVSEAVYVASITPLDKLSYPIGEQTARLFKTDLSAVFQDVVNVTSLNPPQDVKLILQPSIVKFDGVVPHPVYNPWTATIVYKVDVYDRSNTRIYSQTATGEGQTSQGLASGFMGGGGFQGYDLAAEATQMAMDQALRQIIEGLAAAEELKVIKQ